MSVSGKTVYVGMSGGVDSSLSAALLKEQGFDVVGVFIKVWSPDWMPCTWPEERRDAMRVAARLKIPFRTLDLEEEYKRGVVDTMIAEYAAGRTPNPDVLCNKSVKFGGFLKWAREQGADFVATGHYAQIEERDGVFHLLRGADASKDQSYFLWMLNQEQLSHALFPVGGMTKAQVRAEAERRGIPVAEKKDSQGLCFIGHVDIKEFLSRYVETRPGDVVNEAGEVLGTHNGAILYTLGERVSVSAGRPVYVVSKNIEGNILVVAPRENIGEYARDEFFLRHVNWISDPINTSELAASFRYHQEPISCRVEDGTRVVTNVPLIAATGQSLVVWSGNRLVGGGVIA